MSKTIIIHHNDTVAVALEPLLAGDYVNDVTLLDDIPQAHKFALKDIKQDGKSIVKDEEVNIISPKVVAIKGI